MSTTERRVQEIEQLNALWELSSDEEVKAPPRRTIDLYPVLLGAWILVMGGLFLFEPTPSDPNAVIPVWGQILLTVFMAGFFAATYGLASKREWGARASVFTAGLGVAIAVACAATSHHSGAWWGIELASFTALGALSTFALRKT